MIIDESIVIQAPLDTVWKTFTDIACWADWNTVMEDVPAGREAMEKGAPLEFCIRPFLFPVRLEPVIEEVVRNEKVTWSGTKFGISSRHEFFFEKSGVGVRVRSRESFTGGPLEAMSFAFPERRIREMTQALLRDLKKAAEGRHHGKD